MNILWFRNDLRIDDQPALQEAIAQGEAILPVYIFDEQAMGHWSYGEASKWWLHHALASLQERLAKYGAELYFFKGSAEKILLELSKAEKANKLFMNTSNEAWSLEQQRAVQKSLQKRGVAVHVFRGNELVNPDLLLNKQNNPYKVFTPFWRSACQQGFQQPQRTVIENAQWKIKNFENALNLQSFNLLPSIAWDQVFYKHWQPNDKGLVKSLKEIQNKLELYAERRDFPGEAATSRLSPYLAFGQVSPYRVLEFVGKIEGSQKFVAELGWREFSRYLQYHFPDTPDKAMDQKFDAFPWRNDEQDFKHWCEGSTGIPIVDAGMRELWHTGWMHNRVRMITASFLVKHLLIDWRKGARWFWDTLVDADLANNTQGWQWVAGCGADSAPYFRIFNPVTQSKKFDAKGEYIRRWLPELKALPDKYIHEPWAVPESVRHECGLALESDYPLPMIELSIGRERALAALKMIS